MCRMRRVYCDKDTVLFILFKEVHIDIAAIAVNDKKPPLFVKDSLLFSVLVEYVF